MDAQEVQDVSRNQKQWLDGAGVEGRSELGVQPLHGVSDEMSSHWLEPYDARAIGTTFGDVVVSRFPMATATRRDLEQVAMQFQYDIGAARPHSARGYLTPSCP